MKFGWSLTALILAGCSESDRQQADASSDQMAAATGSVAAMPKSDVTEDGEFPGDAQLIGRWIGPEGLLADVRATGPGRYTIAMHYTLDLSGTFPARRDGQSLVVERPDGPVRLTYGAGAETGMKWVDAGAHCLIAKVGQEAYCRPGTKSL